MVRVLRGFNENKIIIVFIVVMLLITVYAGSKQRNMENINSNSIVLYNK